MTKNFAVIEDGLVKNCIVSDSLENAEKVSGLVCVEYTLENPASIGFAYTDGVFVDLNPAPVPTPIQLIGKEE
jgi:hypothetical protein